MKESIKNIIFDFDLTIADTFDVGIKVLRKVCAENGIDIGDDNKLKEFRNMTNREIVKELDIPIWKVPHLLKIHEETMFNEIGQSKFIKGMRELIDDLKENYNLYILTSNSKVNVLKFFEANNYIHPFKSIYSERNLFGKHKELSKLIKEEELKKRRNYLYR
ncbi:MAG: HAD hydrolase-like protein [Candidatus Dojkabacteria bacterium]|nr:HAD hydrolase-like protein [Candidatus Dojkabacteria bacterium]MDQ7020245.1 HAD hydrolase-like protein [Candidatus Dojkabacteria bacterium]